MGASRTIRVTPNVLACLEDLRTGVKAIPAGDARRRAAAALAYLERTAAGERQPARGLSCPRGTNIIKS